VASGQTDPGEIISQINSLMSRDLIKLEMFITMVCVWIPPDRHQIRTASAGHLASIVQEADGTISQIDGTGIPVGIFHDSEYSSHSTPFAPGARLLLYTDGIIEASAPDDTMFELEGVKACLARTRPLCARESVEKLLDEVSAFSNNQAPSDDRTVILLSRTQ
jgi:sigma-B regulation protein RsbU (phosphoserine phosphatase)